MTNSSSNRLNHSNQISYDELFRRLDKNGDGRIDFDELVEQVAVGESQEERAAMARVSSTFSILIVTFTCSAFL